MSDIAAFVEINVTKMVEIAFQGDSVAHFNTFRDTVEHTVIAIRGSDVRKRANIFQVYSFLSKFR